MDKFLGKYNLPKLNEEAESLNTPITADKIEVVIMKKKKNNTETPNTQKPWTGWFHRENFTKHLRRS